MFGGILGKLMPGPGNKSPTLSLSDSDSGSDTEVFLSIEKSRKRHLSPGVLRGDQVADCLRVQEASASPLLKKAKPLSPSAADPPPGQKMALSEDFFKKYMDSTVLNRLESLDVGLADLKTTVTKVNRNVKINTAKIDKHEGLIKSNAAAIVEMREEMNSIKSKPVSFAAAVEGSSRSVLEQRPLGDSPDPEYWIARRSLRIWPIPGNTREEMWTATENFMKHFLGLSASTISCIDIISRPVTKSCPSAIDEVLVRFTDNETRDSVMGASGKLSGRIDANGKPTAGIRIEITPKLRPVMKILDKYGQQLRSRHGIGTRRHFKFDDLDMTLYLNVKLPGDLHWSKVNLELARRGLQSRERYTSEEIEKRFDINGPHRRNAAEARPASVGDTPSTSRGGNSQWTGQQQNAQ